MSRPETIKAALSELPGIRREQSGPVFAEPWHAQAFAITVMLNERGLFTWREWAEMLSRELRGAEAAGEAEGEDGYYGAWLNALERLLTEKAVVPEDERQAREDAWQRAARATPHGQPVTLDWTQEA